MLRGHRAMLQGHRAMLHDHSLMLQVMAPCCRAIAMLQGHSAMLHTMSHAADHSAMLQAKGDAWIEGHSVRTLGPL